MLAQSGDTKSLSSQTVSKMVCAPSLSVTRWNKNAAVQRTVQWNHFINKEQLVSLWACEFSLSHTEWLKWVTWIPLSCEEARYWTFPSPSHYSEPFTVSVPLRPPLCLFYLDSRSFTLSLIYLRTDRFTFPPSYCALVLISKSGEEKNNSRESK